MKKAMTFHRKKIWLVFLICAVMMLGMIGRLVYLMGFRSDYYYQKAQDLHERERDIKAARGQILDAQGRIWTQKPCEKEWKRYLLLKGSKPMLRNLWEIPSGITVLRA